MLIRCIYHHILIIKCQQLTVKVITWAPCPAKGTSWHVHPSKTLISMCIHTIWSESTMGALESQGSNISSGGKLRLWSDCVVTQTDLNLGCTHMPYTTCNAGYGFKYIPVSLRDPTAWEAFFTISLLFSSTEIYNTARLSDVFFYYFISNSFKQYTVKLALSSQPATQK